MILLLFVTNNAKLYHFHQFKIGHKIFALSLTATHIQHLPGRRGFRVEFNCCRKRFAKSFYCCSLELAEDREFEFNCCQKRFAKSFYCCSLEFTTGRLSELYCYQNDLQNRFRKVGMLLIGKSLTAYCLLPTAYCLLPTAYCQRPKNLNIEFQGKN